MTATLTDLQPAPTARYERCPMCSMLLDACPCDRRDLFDLVPVAVLNATLSTLAGEIKGSHRIAYPESVRTLRRMADYQDQQATLAEEDWLESYGFDYPDRYPSLAEIAAIRYAAHAAYDAQFAADPDADDNYPILAQRLAESLKEERRA